MKSVVSPLDRVSFRQSEFDRCRWSIYDPLVNIDQAKAERKRLARESGTVSFIPDNDGDLLTAARDVGVVPFIALQTSLPEGIRLTPDNKVNVAAARRLGIYCTVSTLRTLGTPVSVISHGVYAKEGGTWEVLWTPQGSDRDFDDIAAKVQDDLEGLREVLSPTDLYSAVWEPGVQVAKFWPHVARVALRESTEI